MNICISAGGTGGHIFPAIALADALIEKGHKIFYIGNETKMEAKLVASKPYTFLPINNEGLKPGLLAKVKGLTSQFKAIKQCKAYLREHQIDFVFSFGGYVTFPVCVAAKQLKIPYLIHEQNSIAGKANKAVQKGSAGIIVCFEEVIKQFNHQDIRFYGNPRASIAIKTQKDPNLRQALGLDMALPIVYFVMGSLGSETMSNIVIDYLNDHELVDYQFVISAGRQFDHYGQTLKPQPHVHVFESVDQLSLLVESEIVISRAGATSIAEICALGTPAIYLPSPYVVANHQYHNALELHNHEAALLIEEKDLNGQRLFNEIESLLQDSQKRESMKESAKKYGKPHAIEDIIQWMNEVLA